MRPHAASLVALSLVLVPLVLAADAEKALKEQWKRRSKELEAELGQRTLISRVPIKRHAALVLRPDGTLNPDAKQKHGKHELHFEPGDVVRKVIVNAHWSGAALLGVQCCRECKRAFMPQVVVHFGAFERPDDLQPGHLLRALSGMFDIQGYDPTAAVSGVIAALAEPAAPSLAATGGAPVVSALAVRVEPDRIGPGESVELVLEYVVEGAPGSLAQARESRELRHLGQALPGYPRDEFFERAPGTHRTALSQRVPASAAAGSYELRGEVCIGDACSSRVARFEVAESGR